MVRPMRKTRAPTQSQRAIGHIAALQSIATMFVMHAMVGRSTLQFKMPRLDAYVRGALGWGHLHARTQRVILRSEALDCLHHFGLIEHREELALRTRIDLHRGQRLVQIQAYAHFKIVALHVADKIISSLFRVRFNHYKRGDEELLRHRWSNGFLHVSLHIPLGAGLLLDAIETTLEGRRKRRM